VVSGFLHDHVGIGDRLRLSHPYGELTLRAGEAPLVLVSAGVGVTPLAAILDHVSRTQPTRDVTAVPANRSMERHPLRADMITNGSRLLSFRNLVWYEQTVSDAPDAYTGFMDTDAIPLHLDADVYLCGPVPVRADGPGRPAPPRRAGRADPLRGVRFRTVAPGPRADAGLTVRLRSGPYHAPRLS
jgi:nitric oxide dioxygenase